MNQVTTDIVILEKYHEPLGNIRLLARISHDFNPSKYHQGRWISFIIDQDEILKLDGGAQELKKKEIAGLSIHDTDLFTTGNGFLGKLLQDSFLGEISPKVMCEIISQILYSFALTKDSFFQDKIREYFPEWLKIQKM